MPNTFAHGSILHIFAFSFLAVVAGVLNAAPVPVQITTSSNGSVQLLRGGAPYIVKGVGGFANPSLAASCGANSIRTWGTENAQANLDTAQTHGLTVNLGIWLPHDANYNDTAFRNSWKTAVTNLANTYKNHPALLVWSLGNELNIPANYTGTWTLLQELAAIIKSIDPNHPVMTVLAGAPTSVLNTLATTCPSIDLVGFNVYAGIDGVPAAVAAATAWTKPYMITEWGPNGHWESAGTSWGRPIEAHSSAKAALYSSRAALIDSWRPRCLGSYVFFWDQKQERTPTWYSMFLENRPLSGLAAQACPTVDSMAAFWNGSVPGNRAPVFHSATLNGTAAPASLQAAPGKMEAITINATDPDGNALTIVPEILKEPSQLGDLGSWEGRPEALGDNARATGNTITFTMPPAGQYRLFAYIMDGQGKAATWNLPLLSTGTALAFAPQPFNALSKAIPGTIQAEEFDRGGLGISYSDTTAANLGEAFRNTAVDIEPCTDAGGGHNLGWLAPGEWLNYRISAASAVTVRPKLRVANLNTGGVVRLLLNGTNITGNLTIPATGGWQTFADLQAPSNISVAAGNHTLRLEVVANGPNNSAVGNINSITFDSAGLQPPVVSYASWLGSIGLPFTAKIAASNSPTSFAIAAGSLPPGLSLNTSNGSVTGIPSQTGILTASVTATNSAGTSPAQTIAISIGGSSIPEITSSANASGAVGALFSFQTNATNTPTRYTASGLPGGLSINATTGLVGGIPVLDGVYAAKVNAVNAVGTASKNMTFTIAATLPVIQNNGTAIPRLSMPFSLSINATNAPRSFGATGLPPGLSVNSTTGNITGTPTVLGNFTANISATNPAGTATKSLLFRVLPQRPLITSSATSNGTFGSPLSYQIAATNSPTGFSASGLPSGLTINSTSGLITGIPSIDGAVSAVIGATNSGGTSSQNLTFSIASILPVITSNESLTSNAGNPVAFRITARNRPRSFGASGLPAGLSVNSTTGNISGTPSVTGNFAVTLSATNPAGTATKPLSLVLLPAPPVIASAASANASVGSPFSFQVSASNSPTRFLAKGLPSGLSINATSGAIRGTPLVDGLFATVVTASNAGGSHSKNMTLSVAPTLPVIQNNGTVALRISQPFAFTINATNAVRTFGASSLPPGLSVNSSTGNITGTPTVLGNFTVTLSATNPAGTATKSLLFRVLPLVPVISSAPSVSATCGIPFSHSVTASNSPTSFAASGLPAGLGINATTGLVSGTPATSGNFISKITASNAGGSGSQNLSLVIAAAVPLVTNSATINASTGAFVSQPVLALYSPTSFSATGLPSGLSINATTGFITGIPTIFGSINATLRATNSAGTGSKQVVFKILPVDPVDVRHIRIRSAAGGCLRETANGATPSFENAPSDHDLRTHWTLEANPDRSGVRIRNRHSGLVMHVQPQDGVVRSGSLAANYTSTHWTLNGSSGNLTLGSLWQSGQFMAKGGNGTLVTGTAAGDSTASRFQFEDLAAGAAVPWTTYDETNTAAIIAPAHVLSNSYNASFDINNRAAEASGQACILLNGFGTSARWTVLRAADALTLRYSVDDGVTGNITLKLTSVNGTVRTRKIPVTSAQAWVYFDSTGNEYNSPATGRIPAKRFNEARIQLLPSDGGGVQAGDSIEFAREAGDAMVWIDLVEAETMAPVSAPVGFLNVKAGYGAVGDGTTIDTQAFRSAIAEAASLRKGLYIPSGTYRLDGEIILPPGTVLQGAGVWETELLFSATGSEASGGIKGNGSNIAIRDFYIRGSQNSRTGGYKGLKGWWGTNSKIENIWIEQTAVGAWIADLNTNLNVTDGLLIRNCRVRNTFADGINLAGGTKNSVVENCHIRGAGDDGLATWSSGKELGKPATSNQIFRYNTIQCVYRAGGIGLFGGSGHKVHHNLVEDQVAGPGIRANSVFQMAGGVNTGWPFGTVASVISENTLRRTGSVSLYSENTAAVELQAWYGPVQALRFTSNRIVGTMHQAVRLTRIGSLAGASFSNIQFENTQLSSVPAGLAVGAGSAGAVTVDSAISSAGTTNSSSSLSLTVR